LLLYKRITGARQLGFEDIPALMDEYNELENIFFGKIKVDNEAKASKLKGLYEYTNLLNPPSPDSYVSYRLLLELCNIFKEKREERVMKKLIDYGVLKSPNEQVKKQIEMAGNYADDFGTPEKIDISLDDTTKKALKELAELLQAEKKPEDLQNTIYQVAKGNNIQPREFFKILYQIILSTNRGPKIGPFIEDIGKEKVAQTIMSYLWWLQKMVHDEHNKPKKSGSFLLIILGAVLLIIAPTIYPNESELGFLAFVFGFIIGGIGFYVRFIRKARVNWAKCSCFE